MANNELERFLLERLLDLDPLLSDSPDSPMYSKVINPVIDRLGVDPLSVHISDFITQRIKDDPITKNMDIESVGSYLKDMVSRPLTILLEPLQREIEHLKTQQSFATPEQLTRDEVDALLSNIFSTRKYGDFATTVVRCYYSIPQPVAVDASIVFSTLAGLQFIPSEPQTKVEGDFTREGEQYYVEFDVQSLIPHVGGNVQANAIKLVSGLENVIRVTNPTSASGGITQETDEEFIRRAERSLSERSLNTRRGIQTSLFNNFDSVESIDVIGYRDPEMQRDILTGSVSVDLSGITGEVLYTSSSFTGVNIGANATPTDATQLQGWTDPSTNFPFTNVVQLQYATAAALLTVYNKISGGVYVRIFDTASSFDDKHLGILREIESIKAYDTASPPVEVDPSHASARNLWITLKDFDVVTHGLTLTTEPNDNSNSDQGSGYHLRNSSNIWRGAPLPFTDVANISGVPIGSTAVSDIQIFEDRDFLVVRGQDGDTVPKYYWRVFPLRTRESATSVRVKRSDSYMLSADRVSSTATYTYSPTTAAGVESPEVVTYGCPGPDGETDSNVAHNGISTVAEGIQYQGGVALFQQDGNELAHTYAYLASHASRPNGWASLGIEVGHFISLSGIHLRSASYNTTGYPDLWVWGRVSAVEVQGDDHLIKIEGIPRDPFTAHAVDFLEYQLGGFASPPAALSAGIGGNWWGFHHEPGGIPQKQRYRLHWTVYRGEVDTVLSNGNLHTSYDDFAFLPAYDITGNDSLDAGDDTTPLYSLPVGYVTHPGRHTILSDALPAAGNNYQYKFGTGLSAHPSLGQPINNRASWAIVRLAEKFQDMEQDDGTYITASDTGADQVDVTSMPLRYPEQTGNVHYMGQILPFSLGDYYYQNVGLATVSYTAGFDASSPNKRGVRGVTVPNFINADSEEVLQVFDDADASVSDPVLSISDIPGSYPFTEEFGDPLTVNSGEVHIGGMTDVYLKGGSLDNESVEFDLYPNSVEVGTDTDLVIEATDGIITGSAVTPKVLSSVSLGTTFTSDELENLVDYVVEITDSSETTSIGRSSRIVDVDYATSSLRVVDDLNDTGVSITATYRIYKQVTTSLNTPKHIWLTGTDLYIPLGLNQVTSAVGFASLPTDQTTFYIKILSGDLEGEEYVVSEVGATTLTLTETMSGPESNVEFEIYTKFTGVDFPMVRLTSVELASEEADGITIPYAHPVDVLAESFSGLNNDPIELTDLVLRPAGDYTADPTVPAHAQISNTNYAHLYRPATYDWEANGIAVSDVVRVSTTSADDTFFFIRDIVGTGNSVLILDRDISLAKTAALTGSVGKPSLGNVRVLFREPTYCEVGPSTVFATLDGTQYFRPSPGEEADIYETPYTSTDVAHDPSLPTAANTTATLTSTLLDFSRLGIRPNDTVTINRKVLLGSDILNATADNMSTLVGKTFIFTADGVQRSIVFTSTGTLTLTDIANQLNSKYGDILRAANVPGTAPGTHRALVIYSSSLVIIQDSSSPVLTTLGLTLLQSNLYTEVVANVTDVTANAAAGTTSLELSASSGTFDLTFTDEVFFSATRDEYQIIYPADMEEDDIGLYYFDVTAASMAPLSETTDRVAEDTQMTVTGYTSFGYSLAVDNDNYSFSAAEVCDLIVTPIILPDYADSMEVGFVCPTASVSVQYEQTQLTDDVQAFLLSDFNRVVNNNPLSRHFLPAYLYVTLQVDGGKSTTDLKADIVKYMLSLFPNKTLEAYDLERVLSNGGVESVLHPITMAFLVHDEDRTIKLVRDDSAITLDSKYHIMEDEANITVSGQ